MIQWTEMARELAFGMWNSVSSQCFGDAKARADMFAEEWRTIRNTHDAWTDKLIRDNLAESGEDRFRREKYGIKEDE